MCKYTPVSRCIRYTYLVHFVWDHPNTMGDNPAMLTLVEYLIIMSRTMCRSYAWIYILCVCTCKDLRLSIEMLGIYMYRLK